eukprot:scaffold22334_cov71-Phaeocystis_antarctica.AAC.1
MGLGVGLGLREGGCVGVRVGGKVLGREFHRADARLALLARPNPSPNPNPNPNPNPSPNPNHARLALLARLVEADDDAAVAVSAV